MELADNTNINLSMSRQCYHKRRKTDKTRLANFLSDHELLVDSTHPEAYLNILKQKRDEINEKWLDNYYTDPTTKVFAGGNEKTPEHHWRCEMAKLNQMIVESERTLAETEDVPELIPEQAVELAAQEEQPRQPTASDDANALMATMLAMLTRMSADIEALKIQIAAVNTPAATGSAAVAAAAAASNSGNIDNDDDDDDDDFSIDNDDAAAADDDDDDDIDINNVDSNQKKRKRHVDSDDKDDDDDDDEDDDEKADDDADADADANADDTNATIADSTVGTADYASEESKKGGKGEEEGLSSKGRSPVAAAVAAATLTNNDNNNENNSNNNNKNDDNNSNQNDNNGMDNEQQQQQQQQFQQPQPDGVVSNGVEQAEQQQQEHFHYGDRVIVSGLMHESMIHLNGKQGIVVSAVLPTSPSMNPCLSTMTDDDKRNAIWYNVFLETDKCIEYEYIKFPSTYLRRMFCVVHDRQDNKILGMLRANPVANDGDKFYSR